MISSRGTYEQGVLFVHGIGSQKQGDTLVRWGDALAQWIGDWSKGHGDGQKVRFADVVLHPQDGSPAHGDLLIGYGDERRTWLVEEVWWAGDVQTPTYSQLATFTIKALPMTLLGLVGGAARRHRLQTSAGSWPTKLYHWLWMGLTFVIGLPLALALTPMVAALILVLLVAGLLPIPAVRSRVQGVQRALTLTVGDSMILLSSPTQRAAMTSRVVNAVRFAQSRGCHRLTIVAHSQGAAIVKKALEEHTAFAPRPHLITVGSGINRLQQLENQGKGADWMAPGLLAAAGLFGGLLWLLEDAGEITWTGLAGWGLGYLGLIFALGGLVTLPQMFGGLPRRAARAVGAFGSLVMVGAAVTAVSLAGDASVASVMLLAALGAGGIGIYKLVFRPPVTLPADADLRDRAASWLDLYSGADPVPNGPTVTSQSDWPNSIEVSNADSKLFDHVRYERESDDALALISRALLRGSTGPVQLGTGDVERIERARAERRRRLSWLRVTRWVSAVAAVGYVALHQGDVRSAGRNGYDWIVDTVGVPSWMSSSVTGDEALALGIAGVALIAFGLYLVLANVWAAWNTVEARALFVPDDARPRTLSLVLLTLLVWGGVAQLYAGLVLDDWDELAVRGSTVDWVTEMGIFVLALLAVSFAFAYGSQRVGAIKATLRKLKPAATAAAEKAPKQPRKANGAKMPKVKTQHTHKLPRVPKQAPDASTAQDPARQSVG